MNYRFTSAALTELKEAALFYEVTENRKIASPTPVIPVPRREPAGVAVTTLAWQLANAKRPPKSSVKHLLTEGIIDGDS